MNKKINTLVPEIRFPEFAKEGEWFECTIDSIGDVVTGGTPSKEDTDFWGGDFVWATAQDFKEKYILNSVQKLTQKGKDKSRVIPKDSVLVTCIASIGLNAINKIECATNQQINSIICNSKNHFEFVYYSISQNGNRLKNLAGRTAVPIINKSIFEKFTIHKPQSPKEQQKIASCLSSLDELIAAHNQKLDTLKDHKKGLMQNLFPQEGEKKPTYRFKEFEKDGQWVQTYVQENCLVKGRIGYRGYTTEDLVGQGLGALVLGGKHIQNQMLELKNPTYLSWEKYYESPEIMVEVGDIIFSQRGTLGDCAIIEREIGPATINPSMVLLKNITCDARFLYYILISDRIQIEVRKNRAMGAIPMLSQKQIKEFPFLIPMNPKEQQKIASCLSFLDELIMAQSDKINQLKLHKKGLMQDLFPKIQD